MDRLSLSLSLFVAKRTPEKSSFLPKRDLIFRPSYSYRLEFFDTDCRLDRVDGPYINGCWGGWMGRKGKERSELGPLEMAEVGGGGGNFH